MAHQRGPVRDNPTIQKANQFVVDVNAFCTPSNSCTAGTVDPERPESITAGTCQRSDFHCWWIAPGILEATIPAKSRLV
jgi:hypothetical protein